MWPLDGPVTSGLAAPHRRHRRGIDIDGDHGAAAVAAPRTRNGHPVVPLGRLRARRGDRPRLRPGDTVRPPVAALPDRRRRGAAGQPGSWSAPSAKPVTPPALTCTSLRALARRQSGRSPAASRTAPAVRSCASVGVTLFFNGRLPARGAALEGSLFPDFARLGTAAGSWRASC